MVRRVAAKPGFTLVELLAVIAIIVLLIGILVPALNAARDQAKKASTAARIKALDAGAEMFHQELDKYPRSAGLNPFLSGSSEYLSGAQWLLVQLSGPDLRGYVKPIKSNDTNGDGRIDNVDWDAWYALGANYTRVGPFVPSKGDIAINAQRYSTLNPSADPPPPPLDQTTNNWDGGKIPFYLDGFNYPILYYRANTSKVPFTTRTGGVGRYDQSDNAVFTANADEGRDPTNYDDGWNLKGSAKRSRWGALHPLATLMWNSNSPSDQPELETFEHAVHNASIFANTQQSGNRGRVWPHNPDGFLLVSPGKDGLYGTQDDVRNF